jgi:hypothetical protein
MDWALRCGPRSVQLSRLPVRLDFTPISLILIQFRLSVESQRRSCGIALTQLTAMSRDSHGKALLIYCATAKRWPSF